MKKTIVLILVVIFVLSICCGCANFGNDVKLSSSITLDESGIVSKQVFASLKEQNAVVTITGYDGDIKYQWTVFGSEIETAKDLDMTVHCVLNDKGNIELSFACVGQEDFGFAPVLSIYVPVKWDVQTATAYTSDNKAFCGVSITSGTPTILNFTVTRFDDTLTIRADSLPNTTLSPSVTPSATPSKINNGQDDYLSTPNSHNDKYLTDPIPSGKPHPIEPDDVVVDESKKYTCTFSIECTTILNNINDLNPEKLEVLPPDGIILTLCTVNFSEGESVFDVLQRICHKNKVHMEASGTPMYNSAYVEGINNLYEFDCGELSGWMYRVNGWYPNYGASRYQLKDGDIVEWRYTCDMGRDVGCSWDVAGT